MRVAVPDATWVEALGDLGDVDLVVWDPANPQPEGWLDLVVWPYVVDFAALAGVDVTRVGVIQGQSLGFDGVAEALAPGGVYCNAVGVHEESTAELALTLALAAARRLDLFVGQQGRSQWQKSWTSSLIDRRVLVLGVGGIGGAVVRRLDGFGCEIVRMASRARDDERGHVHGVDELAVLLPSVQAVIVAVPLAASTVGLVDAAFLAALPDDAIVVNVSRGKVVDSAAMLAEVGRLRFACDVVDPEPLPEDHRLWTAPGVIITPHVGGMSSAMRPRIERVVREQISRLASGRAPLNVVVS